MPLPGLVQGKSDRFVGAIALSGVPRSTSVVPTQMTWLLMAIFSWRGSLLASIFLDTWKPCHRSALEKGRRCLGEHICPDWLVTLQSGYDVIELRAPELNLCLEKQNEDEGKV